jgi:SAM-dependent methyltransferase
VTDAFFRSLARDAAASYPPRDRFARHFAYGKLTRDPAFAHLLRASLVPQNARLLDLGCGQGLVAALLHAARARHVRDERPAGWPEPPSLASYTGVELLARDVARGRAMAEHWAPGQAMRAEAGATTFVEGDIRTIDIPASDAVVILDVLHYLDYDAQAKVLERVRAALTPRGVLILRVSDESGTLRFRLTLLLDRLSTRLRGVSLPRLWCRPAAAWRAELERLGFRVEAAPMSAGTPFANVLLVARYDS